MKKWKVILIGCGNMAKMHAARFEEVKDKKLCRLDWKGQDFPIYSQLIVYKGKRLSRAAEELRAMIMPTASMQARP